jgi:uncharacterized protein with HEPN domain
MSRHDDTVRMRHMLDHAREAVAMVSGRSRQDLHVDRMLQLAVTHLVEVVGGAASRVSNEGRSRYPEIPGTTRSAPATESSTAITGSTTTSSGGSSR